MKLLQQLVVRKYKEYFIDLKNNRFNPMSFMEVVSLIDSQSSSLTKNQKKLRILLLRSYYWNIMKQCIPGVKVDTKREYNYDVKARLSVKIMPFVNELNECISSDEAIISKFMIENRIEEVFEEKKKSYPDIKQKWSIGYIKEV